ncbi:ABC transporter ATP-binding protein [Actinoplanes ianthinogenes]|uniref:ABC transporter ATP-binding protein n=1 Tax=Actinoplanes ianthinogenes TaxID=122358 RepID=A0ABN6CF56_9ACTN|nr:ABC transporter ATP-binding protein [Actinoplanes ianthinogenes]BCJ44152.1 ABC transporter ATP-binding protein [Actinoplanes ianthinogenes]GGQ96115.1 ABC transporter ATP-binding protein [Actinoplanes ianthinogenes]
MNVTIENLSKDYKGGHRALDGIDLTVGTGMIGLLGANGAGKTTLMRILAGVLRPTSGRITIGGHDLATSAGRTAVKRMLGYLPQELPLYTGLTGREFLDYIALLKGIDDKGARRRQIDLLLDRVGLSDQANRRIGGYSGGMKRRIGIAQTLLGDPRLIIVDEPTSGLDPEERMRFRTLLASLGGDRTVLLSTHILADVAQSCPQVAVLNTGRLVYFGSTTGLTDAAEDRTYLVHSDGPAPEGCTVVNATTTATGTEYRIVGDPPPAGARRVEPTLEDGYVALLQTHRETQETHR